MNREIKFRAWDGKKIWNIDGNSSVVLEYCYISGWNIVPNKSGYTGKYLTGESYSEIGIFELMQYTGLKDKNGKEIYEGDILYYSDAGECTHAQVIWNNERGGWDCIRSEDGASMVDYYDFDCMEDMVVIGNIYEHKHLLK